jgi:hypothetical protein
MQTLTLNYKAGVAVFTLSIFLQTLQLTQCAAAADTQAEASGILKILVKKGDGSLNNIRKKLAQEPVVEVVDESGKPVAGADVTFTLPFSGPGGQFAGGSRVSNVKTDAAGRASSGPFTPNTVEGRFNLSVKAVKGSRQGSATLSQSNTLAGGIYPSERAGSAKSSSKKWWVLGLVGGGATAGVLAATKGGSSNTPAVVAARPATSVSVGGVTVGGPR